MKSEELTRLRGLIEQLIERLNQERSTNAELRRTLELRDVSQLRGESDSLL